MDSAASAQGVADGKTAVAWTKKLTKNDQAIAIPLPNMAKTAMTSKLLPKTNLPKYDKNGHLYEYRAVEVIDGLANKPVALR